MKNIERVFDHPSQLNALSALPFVKKSGRGRLRLAGTVAEHPDRERWEAELNRYYHACGCDTSAAVLLVGLVLGAVWSAYAYFGGMYSVATAVIVAVVLAIGGGVLGKLYGLIRANRKLKESVRAIQERWKTPEQPVERYWTCG